MLRPDTAALYQRLQNKVAEYVENNLSASFGIGALADYTHVSYHHLADIFRHTHRESLGHYITRIKLERAAMLSAYTPLNLSEIADATGFATKHSLSKAFTGHFGFSPGKAKAMLIRTDSINAVMDGISSEAQYQHIVREDFSFTFQKRTLTGGVLAGYTWHFGDASPAYERTMPYLDNLLAMTLAGQARRCMKIFDSVNFTAVRDYRMFYGVWADDARAIAPDFDGLTLSIRPGTYLVFDVPPGDRDDIKHHITRFRESLVWYKKIFTVHGFYDFFLLHDGPDNGGEYYLYTHP
jgi:AraC-like DNA-binding protein